MRRKSLPLTLAAVSAATLATALALPAVAAPQAAAPQKPAAKSSGDPRVEALLAWLEGYFPWGAGEIALDEISAVKIPGWKMMKASKKYSADERANDQTYLAVEEGSKVALLGDVFVDEDRLKAPVAIKSDMDLEPIKAKIGRYFRGKFRLTLDPALDRKSWKGLKVSLDTGYGAYDVQGFVTAGDGALVILGRAWDRGKPLAEQRRAMINLAGTPSSGPADATVTVVEYSDMQCPFCKKRSGDWEALIAKLDGTLKIRRYFKAFPLTDHPWAFRAASAGYCFEMKDPKLFSHWKSQVYSRQEQMGVSDLDTFALDFALANGISQERFQSCFLQGDSARRIHADLAEGFAVRVRSTPTYYIDGVPVSWFADNLMEEYLRKTYLKGAGLPLPAAPAAAPVPIKAPAKSK